MIRETMRLSSAEGSATPGAHEQLEMLINRLADGEGAPSDWAAFSMLAAKVSDAWEQLAKAQRDHAALSVAVGVALHAAERVELPSRAAAEQFAGVDSEYAVQQHAAFWSRARSWGGWAAAAALILAWTTGGLNRLGTHVQPQGNLAGVIPAGYQKIDTTDDAVNAYLNIGQKKGSVLGEVPQRVMIDRRLRPDGKYEVTYLRQFIEKVEVSELLGFGATDEAGNAVATPVKPQTTPDTPQ